MKIVIAAHNVRVGGGITYLLNVLKHLSFIGGISELIVYSNSRFKKEIELFNMQDNMKINIICEKTLDRNIFIRLLWFYFILPYKLFKSEADVFFSPGGTIPFFMPRKITKIVVCQNLQPFFSDTQKLEGIMMTLKLQINKALLIDSFKKADGIIFLTEYARSLIKKMFAFNNCKTTIIPHGVEDEYFNVPNKEKNINVGKNRYYKLLYVSALKSYKRHAELIGAIKKLIDRGYSNLKLLLIGAADKPIKNNIEYLIDSYKMNEVVEYRGEVPLNMMSDIYKSNDIFVFPSVCESFALPLLEATAAGLPVLASKYPPMTEILQDAALYFDPDDEVSIAGSIEKVLSSPELCHSLSLRAYKRARQFSWKVSVNKLYHFLKEVKQTKNQKQ
ncbi:MAG: glycosyltransferase family 1 protein [Candidatus Margulisiibacteriota bacterium]